MPLTETCLSQNKSAMSDFDCDYILMKVTHHKVASFCNLVDTSYKAMPQPRVIKYCYVPCGIVSMHFVKSERAGACVKSLGQG